MLEDLMGLLQRWSPVLIIGVVMYVVWDRIKIMKKRFGDEKKPKKEHWVRLKQLIAIIKGNKSNDQEKKSGRY